MRRPDAPPATPCNSTSPLYPATTRPPAAHAHSARSIWLISFTDLICLLLAFFMLKFSMSEPVSQRWQQMAASMAARQAGGKPGATFNVSLIEAGTAINLDYLATLLTTQFTASSELGGVMPRRLDDRVVIGLPDGLLFEADQATFSPAGQRILFVLGGVLGRIGNRIEIAGHADQENPADPDRDAWQLSLARGVAVANALRSAGYQRRLVVRSQGDVPALRGRAHLIDIVVRDLEEGV